MRPKFNYLLSIMGITLVALTSCAPLAMDQSPKVIAPGEKAILYGGTYGYFPQESPVDFDSLGIAHMNFRSGLSDRMEWGIAAEFSKTYNITVDLKYQFLEKPFLLAGDLGCSLTGFYPLLLFGTEHLYGGLRYNIFFGGGGIGAQPAGVFIGASFGKKLKIRPQISFQKWPYDDITIVTFGLSLESPLR